MDIKLCKYGCGNTATFLLKDGTHVCSKHWSACPAIRLKNSQSNKKAYENGDRICPFTDEHRRKAHDSKQDDKIKDFIDGKLNFSNYSIKKLLLQIGVEYKCSQCMLTKWQSKDITLELDHIDGNSKNNDPNNLRLMCPNCHSQTDTWRGRNINSGKKKVSDQDIINAFKKCGNIRQCLLEVGLAPKGGNYERVKKLTMKERI